MAYLEEIPEYKDDILKTFIEKPNIITYIDNKDALPIDLIGENIFPYPYIPHVQEDVRVFISLDVYVPRTRDKLIKDVQIVINVFAHKDKSLYKGKSRVDLLTIEIDKIMNGNYNFGIDAVELVSVLPYNPNMNYFGKQMIYNVQNLNQRRCRSNEHKL